jgi:hypothetical protein
MKITAHTRTKVSKVALLEELEFISGVSRGSSVVKASAFANIIIKMTCARCQQQAQPKLKRFDLAPWGPLRQEYR